MPQPAPNPTEVRHPVSWRSHWMRAAIAMLAATLAVRLTWGWHAARTLRATIDQVRQRGEPVDRNDLERPPLRLAENAWNLLMRAAAAHVPGVDSPRTSPLEYRIYPPYPPAWKKLAQASETAHARVFALARQARDTPDSRIWDEPPGFDERVIQPPMSRARSVAITVSDGALWSHATGNDAEAVERLLVVLRIARALRQEALVETNVTAVWVESLACETAQAIAPGLDAPEGAPLRPPVRRLIADLLDERPTWDAIERAALADQAQWIHHFREVSQGRSVINPLADREAVRTLRGLRLSIEAARQRTMPAVDAILARRPRNDAGWSRYSRWFCAWDGNERYFTKQYRAIAERRATAVSLAAQLFRADHRRWPRAIAELVPDYLTAPPKDPFHRDGRPLGYILLAGQLPGGADRPLIFIDEGRWEIAAIRPEPMYGQQPWWGNDNGRYPKLRQYRDVSRFLPQPPPDASPKAVDRDPQEPDEPRNDPQQQHQPK